MRRGNFASNLYLQGSWHFWPDAIRFRCIICTPRPLTTRQIRHNPIYCYSAMTSKPTAKDDLKLLFQRPSEPLFTTKDNGKVVFHVPQDYYTDRYKPIGISLSNRLLGDDVERTVQLRSITKPNLDFTNPLKLRGPFSLFNRKHQEIASQLTNIFLDASDVETLLSTAAYVKDRVNPYLFQYSLAVATQHRSDTQDISLPSIVQQFPDQFVDSSVFPRAREEGTLVLEESREPIEIKQNFTASEREEEQRMAYFREDIGVNMHHWHWHLVYPGSGRREIIAKDRRGELFYFMHNQILSRYNNERFCSRLGRVKPLNNLRERIPEGYFPKIIRGVNNRAYPARVSDSVLQDLTRVEDDTYVEIAEVERWRDRIHNAIDQGFVIEQGTGRTIPLDETSGIEILGDLIESTDLSVNRQYYGNLHNMGHNLISFVHDPDGRHLEDYSVMADVATAMRDPIFYRWHAFIDSIFAKYKNTLPPYLPNQLTYEGVTVDAVNVQIASKGSSTPTPNVLLTFWQKSDVDLAAGLDFGPGNVYAQFTHLQHAPFEYRISATNTSRAHRQGTCRIFLVPKYDERGQSLQFRDQRIMAIEMDKFIIHLTPGQNEIRRRSDQSSVTIPYERSFRRIGSQFQPMDDMDLAQFQFCGCGWPQHMLLPKGSAEGTPFDVFVMISNYADDRIDQESNFGAACNDAFSFCGLKDQKYPDKRAMGYPFDRNTQLMTDKNVETLSEFTEGLPNATLGEVSIRFRNTIIARSP